MSSCLPSVSFLDVLVLVLLVSIILVMILSVCLCLRLKKQMRWFLLLKTLSRKNLLMMAQPIDRRDRQEKYSPAYFSENEFRMCTPSCELSDMDSEFLKKLDKLRELCGFPIYLNCAYRSKKHDLEHGRSGNSYHCFGRAADVRPGHLDGNKRALIVQNAFRVGLKGVGVYKNFIHVDDRFVDTCWYGE